MGKAEVHKFPDPELLAEAAAQRWLGELRQRRPGNRPYLVALPGGRIAEKFFEAAARQAAEHKVKFEGVKFHWGDERAVPPDSPDSNFAAANRLLLQPLAVAKNTIQRIQGERPSGVAAELAEADLRLCAERFTATGLPIFDLVVLGMGEDGHVASLFPGAEESVVGSRERAYVAVNGPKPPPQRITLTYSMLASADQVWVLASGAGKEEALRESLKPAGVTPLARVIRERAETLLFTDLSV